MTRAGALAAAFLVGLSGLGPARAEETPAAPPESRPKPCVAPEHRQFDFWIGEWDVTTPDGKTAGRNSIRAILGGCALAEEWVGSTGYSGRSFNIYDASTGRWHQTWVDSSGELLRLDGGIVNGKMVLTGTRPPKKDRGIDVQHRVTWEKKSDDEVRQLWEASGDGGQTWDVVFDGTYGRRKE